MTEPRIEIPEPRIEVVTPCPRCSGDKYDPMHSETTFVDDVVYGTQPCSSCRGSGERRLVYTRDEAVTDERVVAAKLAAMAVDQSITYRGDRVTLTEKNNRMMRASLEAFLDALLGVGE